MGKSQKELLEEMEYLKQCVLKEAEKAEKNEALKRRRTGSSTCSASATRSAGRTPS
jgi:hypothetical protein